MSKAAAVFNELPYVSEDVRVLLTPLAEYDIWAPVKLMEALLQISVGPGFLPFPGAVFLVEESPELSRHGFCLIQSQSEGVWKTATALYKKVRFSVFLSHSLLCPCSQILSSSPQNRRST